jgi:hypothetical protein
MIYLSVSCWQIERAEGERSKLMSGHGLSVDEKNFCGNFAALEIQFTCV